MHWHIEAKEAGEPQYRIYEGRREEKLGVVKKWESWGRISAMDQQRTSVGIRHTIIPQEGDDCIVAQSNQVQRIADES